MPAIEPTSPRMLPIGFCSELVQAILDRRKTQTRRLMRPQPDLVLCAPGAPLLVRRDGREISRRHGNVGDILWVREKWAVDPRDHRRTFYGTDARPEGIKLRFFGGQAMPRARCRIHLRITALRAQRLQDISASDALAEGFDIGAAAPVDRFRDFWDSVALREGTRWSDNPWVWVIEFEQVAPLPGRNGPGDSPGHVRKSPSAPKTARGSRASVTGR